MGLKGLKPLFLMTLQGTRLREACVEALARLLTRQTLACGRLLCPSVSASAFIGPGFRDVMPIKETEDRVALFFRVLQWAADIACTSVFLETVRDRENFVLGYRAWIPMDSIAVSFF